MASAKYVATIFPMSDLFSSLALGAVIVVGAKFGPGWHLSLGTVVAFLILIQVFVQPLSELSETFEQTQTAIAGWRKIQGVMDIPLDLFSKAWETAGSYGVLLTPGAPRQPAS